MIKTHQSETGFGAVESMLIVAAVVLLGVVGYMVYKNHNKAAKASVATNTSATTPAATSTPAATDPYAGWKQYCSTQEKSCFKYPADWNTKNIGAADPAGDGISLTSPSGTSLQFQSTVTGLGGGCDPTTDPHIFINKVITVPNASDLFIVEIGGNGSTNHIGLVNGTNGQAPKTGDTGRCIYYTTFKTRHDPTNTSIETWFQSNNPDSLKADDLPTAELILMSYTYQ